MDLEGETGLSEKIRGANPETLRVSDFPCVLPKPLYLLYTENTEASLTTLLQKEFGRGWPIHSFDTFLFSAYYVPARVLGPGDATWVKNK